MDYLVNLTRGNEIGANCYYIQAGGRGVVLDSGMHPKLNGHDALPNLELIDRRPLDAAFLTHAHHDHAGALPVLMQRHPDLPVFMTEPTYFLAEPLLHNSVNIMKRQRDELGISDYPLYTHRDLDMQSKRWQACHLNDRWSLEGFPIADDDPDPATFEFHHAGHILGSAGVELNLGGKKILYTGDVNFLPQTLMTGATLPEKDIDVLIIETTRGAQPTPEGHSRQAMAEKLIRAIRETFERNGPVVIPIFAMGKTQEIITLLHQAQRRGELPSGTIYIGGLGKVFTRVYDRLAPHSRRALQHLQIMEDIRPEVFDLARWKDFKPRRGDILLIPSGMMTEQTTSNRISSLFLSRQEASIFFVGYTDPDSPAGRLRATPQGGTVRLNNDDGDQTVNCRVEHFDFTSHALREDLLAYILRVKPKQCFLVHGDPPALEWFRSELASRLPKTQVHIPASGEEIPLG